MREMLQAIREAPEDDTPRLVYADWLQQRGDPRGELIWVQCALSRPQPPDTRTALEAREQEILDAHEASFRAELPRREGISFGPFERGFVSAVQLASASLLDEELFETTPLTTVRFRRLQNDDLEILRESSARRLVARLEFRGSWLGDASFLRDGWDRLRDLRILSSEIQQGHAPLFAGLDLQRLEIDAPYFPVEIDRIDKRCLASLSSLGLRRNALGGDGVKKLAAQDLGRLLALGLGGNDIAAPVLAALLDATPNLASLDLRLNPIGDSGARAIVSRLRGLRRLDVRGCDIGDKGAAALVASGVAEIDLSCNDVADRSVARPGVDLRLNDINGPDDLPRALDELRGTRARHLFSGEQHHCVAGTLADGRQILLVEGQVLLFDRLGRLLGAEPPTSESSKREADRGYFSEEYDLPDSLTERGFAEGDVHLMAFAAPIVQDFGRGPEQTTLSLGGGVEMFEALSEIDRESIRRCRDDLIDGNYGFSFSLGGPGLWDRSSDEHGQCTGT